VTIFVFPHSAVVHHHRPTESLPRTGSDDDKRGVVGLVANRGLTQKQTTEIWFTSNCGGRGNAASPSSDDDARIPSARVAAARARERLPANICT
jgi:hypothetical protein